MPPGWGWQMAEVDTQGYLIPYAVAARRRAEHAPLTMRQEITRLRGVNEAAARRLWFYAAGIIPPEVTTATKAVNDDLYAAAYPPIPAWLGENPPLFTVFMPNGEILTCGELGLTYLPQPGRDAMYERIIHPAGEIWYRYDGQGRLLASYDSLPLTYDQDWYSLIYPELAARLDGLREQCQAEDPDHFYSGYNAYGYHAITRLPRPPDPANLFLDLSQAEIVALYGWDGQPADPDTPLGSSRGYCQEIDRVALREAYALQVARGITQTGVPSPFAGTPQGPVVVDATPRPQPLLAQYNGGGHVRVRALDDPENPYREQYDAWDRWLVGNVDAFQAELQRRMEELRQARQVEAEQLRAKGQDVPPAYAFSAGYAFKPQDAFQAYDVKVDEAGWVIPQRVLWQEALPRPERDLRLSLTQPDPRAELNTGGEMPAELLAQMKDAKWALELPSYPPIPAWLAAQPVFGAYFIPNGDVVTLGKLGCRPANADELGRNEQWAGQARGYYRYSSQGELLAEYATDGNDWLSLYFPFYAGIVSRATGNGLNCTERRGFLLVMDKAGRELIDAFDYDGTPLDPSQPLTRAPGYCAYIAWDTLVELFQCQQAAQ